MYNLRLPIVISRNHGQGFQHQETNLEEWPGRENQKKKKIMKGRLCFGEIFVDVPLCSTLLSSNESQNFRVRDTL